MLYFAFLYILNKKQIANTTSGAHCNYNCDECSPTVLILHILNAVRSQQYEARSVAVAKKPDRTAYDIRYSWRTEPWKCRVWNNQGSRENAAHVYSIHGNFATSVTFFAVLWLNNTFYSKSVTCTVLE